MHFFRTTLSLALLAALLPGPALALPGVSLVSPTLSLNFSQASASSPIVLMAPTKDPMFAYSLATVPFLGSGFAARYVGTTPLQSEPLPELSRAANNQLLGDFAFLGAGVAAALWLPSNDASVGLRPWALPIGGVIGLFLPIVVHVGWYAPYFSKQAADFNRRQYSELHYDPWFKPSNP